MPTKETALSSHDETAAEGLGPLDGGHRPMFIDGEWVDAADGRTMPTINPSTGETLATVPRGGVADVDRAVAAACRAWATWRRTSPGERQALLLRLAGLVEEHWSELSMCETLDMGKPITRSRAELKRVVGTLRYYAGMATSLDGRVIENSAGGFLTYTVKEPVGVVASIIPWNAPTIATLWKVAPALAAGCTVVLKPSEEAPLSSLLLADLMARAGVPAGVVNVVTGTGVEAGGPLAEHPDVDKIGFTGSTATGQSIVRASAGNLKRVALELGGKSPMVVCSDADLDAAVPMAANAVFSNTGQMCIAASRMFVAAGIYEEFVERVAAHGDALRIGDSADPDTQLGPLVSRRQLERVCGFLESGVETGARIVSGGARISEGALAKGFFVRPTVFTGADDAMPLTTEEIFGPVMSVLRFDSLDEVIARANATRFGLAAGVFTRSNSTAIRLTRELRAGTVWVNTYLTNDPAVPQGGFKMSGYGKEGGAEHLEEFLATKAVWMKYDD